MKFFLIPLLECFREMQRLHREMSNDVAVNEKISWCDSKEWGICVINYMYIIIMFNYSTNIRPRNFLYMSQVRWKLFQSKFSNKIIRLHFFLSFIVTQHVYTEVFFIQMMVVRLMLLLHEGLCWPNMFVLTEVFSIYMLVVRLILLLYFTTGCSDRDVDWGWKLRVSSSSC